MSAEVIWLFPAEPEVRHVSICWECVIISISLLTFWTFVGYSIWSAFHG